MAVITEKLVLEDRFTANFSKYTRLTQQADASTKELNAALRDAKRSASALSAMNRATASESVASAAAYRAQAAQASALAAQERLQAQRARAAAQAVKEQAKAQEDAAKSANQLIDKLKGLFGAYVGLQGIQTLVNMSDQMTQINARLQLMTGSAEEAAAAQDKIFQAAQRSRGAYTDMADLVGQLGMLAPDAFGNTDELIAFAEQLQKQMTISGASGQSAAAAMTQLTQALASGTLRGDELNSVLEQTPMIAKTIADYMGLTTGQLREVAAEGQVTADIVKNAMLSAAEETNAAFEQIPLTWSQVWTMAQNTALQALEPVLNAISWLANNLDIVAPLVLSIAAAFAVYAVAAYGAQAATKALTFAQTALTTVMSLNPFAIAAIGAMLLVGVFYAVIAVINKVTGSTISATGIITGALATAGAFVANVFIALYNTVLSVFGGIFNAGVAVANFFGNFLNNPLAATAHLFGDFVDLILGGLQTIAGVIDTVFGTGLSDAVSGWRNSLDSFIGGLTPEYKEIVPKLDVSKAQMDRIAYGDAWNAGYNWGSNFNLGGFFGSASDATGFGSIPGIDDLTGAVGDVGKDVKGIKKEVSLSDENLKELVDVATGRYVNQVNLTAQTPVITINGQNTGKTKEDRQALADALKMVLAEQLAAGAAGAMALPV